MTDNTLNAFTSIMKRNSVVKYIIILFQIFITITTTGFEEEVTAQNDIIDYYRLLHRNEMTAMGSMVKGGSVSYWFQNDYFIPELMYNRIGMHFSRGENGAWFALSHDGWMQFGEMRFDAGYVRCFGKRFSIALGGVYLLEHAGQYSPVHSFTIDFSSYCQVTSSLGLGIRLFNPILMRYGVTGNEIIPLEFAFRMHYSRGDKILAHLVVEKRIPGGLDAAIGLLYRPIATVVLSGECGLRKIGFGIHIPWKHFLFGVQTDWSYRISFSTAAMILYRFQL